MNQSDQILKTYREISSNLEKPYYVMEGIPANKGNNQVIYSSSNLKDLFGLTQYEFSSNLGQFFESIHPDFIDSYIESNKRLSSGVIKEKRIYLVKNKTTGEYTTIEDLASSRLNPERNCYEIYCSIRRINDAFQIRDESDIDLISKAIQNLNPLSPEKQAKIFETTKHFTESMTKIFKLNACRFYLFNNTRKELSLLADTSNKGSRQLMEATTRLKMRSLIPAYSEDNLIFKYLMENNFHIAEDRVEIGEVLKGHTQNNLIKKFANTAIRIYNLKSFGVLPISCADGTIVGLVTFGASQKFTNDQKLAIYDFTTTNSFAFTCILSEMCNEV